MDYLDQQFCKCAWALQFHVSFIVLFHLAISVTGFVVVHLSYKEICCNV
jgi:hypothetical protein